MTVLSFQSRNAQKYYGGTVSPALDSLGANDFSDPGMEIGQQNTPLPIRKGTFSSFESSTAWRGSHMPHKSLMSGNIGSIIDFNTNQVDPTVR